MRDKHEAGRRASLGSKREMRSCKYGRERVKGGRRSYVMGMEDGGQDGLDEEEVKIEVDQESE